MTETARVEFAVKVKGNECVDQIKRKLIEEANIKEESIKSVTDDNEARIVVSSNKNWIEIHEIIESCGVKSALVGFSEQSAVGILDKGSHADDIKGVVRFCSIPNKKGIIIDGVIDGLKPELNYLSIYEYGDVSDGCNNLGEIYQNSTYEVRVNDSGRGSIRTIDDNLTISELIGRAVCISNSQKEKLACGVISRSAGIFQNYKRICVCSGRVLWDERDLQNIVRS